jgi:hypothetical protein
MALVLTLTNVLCAASTVITPVVLGPGVLAAADPLVLERVELNRLAHGWGLYQLCPAGAARIGVADCSLLGSQGLLLVDGAGPVPACVVDCEARRHAGQMAARGLVADVNLKALDHRRAWVVLFPRNLWGIFMERGHGPIH